MLEIKKIACVTGASGMIGRRICENLVSQGYHVKALSRQKEFKLEGVEVFNGNIEDKDILSNFMQNSHLFFHCAAELYDESKMHRINVLATKLILKLAELYGIKYFCHLSSVGVIGSTRLKLVDELTPCNPQNMYENSKWDAEQLVACGINECKTVILRPTNVIDEEKKGVLDFSSRGRVANFCKIFLFGGECSHIVHAKDVADVAVYFFSHPTYAKTPQCYIVSSDHEPLNKLSGLWPLYNAYRRGKPITSIRPSPHLHLFIPYLLRKILRGTGNMGDVIYSSKKLLDAGFVFTFGVRGAVKNIAIKMKESL